MMKKDAGSPSISVFVLKLLRVFLALLLQYKTFGCSNPKIKKRTHGANVAYAAVIKSGISIYKSKS